MNSPSPPPQTRWVPGAEPVALCMNCNGTFPPDTTECPKCHFTVSQVRKCPNCERVQSAQHIRCIYCSSSFIGEAKKEAESSLPRLSPRAAAFPGRLFYLLAGAVAFVVLATYLTLDYLRELEKPKASIGQTYVLRATSLRQGPSLNTPPVKDLVPPAVVDITDVTIDPTGHRWFQISTEGVHGYALASELAPPKGTNAENGFLLLKFSLLGLDDPAVLPEATQAVDYYRAAFVDSPYREELAWLLAERTRQLIERSSQPQTVLRRARELYGKIAEENGTYAGQARQTLAELPTRVASGGGRSASGSSRLEFSVVGGRLTPSPGASSGSAPVRTLTVLERTVLSIVLTVPVTLSPGAVFQGEVAQDIRVNQQVAIPMGSVCHLRIEEAAGTAARSRAAPSVILRLNTIIVDGQAYSVSASATRVAPPPPSAGSAGSSAIPQLGAGTRFSFRLNAPLVISRS